MQHLRGMPRPSLEKHRLPEKGNSRSLCWTNDNGTPTAGRKGTVMFFLPFSAGPKIGWFYTILHR